jgi:ribonuclease HI
MAYQQRKYYVVWEGYAPGIYDSWEECQQQTHGYPGAKFKSFSSLEAATEAYRGDPREQLDIVRAIASHKQTVVNYSAFPDIRLDAIAVDGACSVNPGPMEYRGVKVATGEEIFHYGPVDGGTNNIGEYVAIIHAASLLAAQGDYMTPIYSDSRTALSWIRNRHSRTTIKATAENAQVRALLARADAWISTHNIPNPLLKWNTEAWGETPADFGRK